MKFGKIFIEVQINIFHRLLPYLINVAVYSFICSCKRSGLWYYTLDNGVLQAGRPQLIRETWPLVGGSIDTAFYLEPLAGQPGQLFIFKV